MDIVASTPKLCCKNNSRAALFLWIVVFIETAKATGWSIQTNTGSARKLSSLLLTAGTTLKKTDAGQFRGAHPCIDAPKPQALRASRGTRRLSGSDAPTITMPFSLTGNSDLSASVS